MSYITTYEVHHANIHTIKTVVIEAANYMEARNIITSVIEKGYDNIWFISDDRIEPGCYVMVSSEVKS